ncbi:MAG: FtsX-like permease family protein [Deltaproteobacteria bacterium]|nr:MAG: FtsX-like permease family protein [Deltaproteobacteria bacterium]
MRKLRTLLSTLGIVFGVAAVISMMSIGEGARREATEQIKLLGTNNIRVKRLELTGEMRAEAERRFSRGLTYDDALLVRDRLPGLLGVAPVKFLDQEARFGARQGVAQVVGTTPEYQDVTNFRVGQGRFLSPFDLRDSKRVCVLGSELKQDLFGYADALGAALTIGQSSCQVVGVMEPKLIREGRGAVIKLRNINRDVYLPITTALRRFPRTGDPAAIEEIAVRVADASQLSVTARAIRGIVGPQHRDVEDYEVMVPEELLAQAQRTQRIFNIVMGSIAGISLLVGGIGIMNIMLANVSERTREIGVRRAIGASKRDVLRQFLIETVLVCLAGGTIGTVIGFGMAKGITLYAGWATAFSLVSVLIAFGTAASVGLLFGLFPARQAAELHPVQALRFE